MPALIAIIGILIVLAPIGLATWLTIDAASGQLQLGVAPAGFWAALVAASASLAVLGLGKLSEIWIDHSRREREKREMVFALHAEILSNIERQRETFSKTNRAALFASLAKRKEAKTRIEAIYREAGLTASRPPQGAPETIQANGKPDTPSSIADRENYVLDSLRSTLFRLPDGVVAPVVVYYNLDGMLNRLIDETGHESFKAHDIDRQKEHWIDVFTLTNKVDAAADRALGKLLSSLRGRTNNLDRNNRTPWVEFERAEAGDAPLAAPSA